MKIQQLTNKNIQIFIDELEKELNKVNIQKYNKTWMRIFLEETLLKYQDALGKKTEFSFNIKKRLATFIVEFSVYGESLNVLRPKEYDGVSTDFLDNIFNNKSDGQVLYNYKDQRNIISVSMPIEARKLKLPGSKQLHAIVIAIVISLLLKLLPSSFTDVLVNSYVSPVYSVLMSALKGLMEPVIFISLVIGICAIDDLKTLSTIGKKTLLSFLKISTIMFVISVGVCMLAFPSNGVSSQAFNPANILELLLASIPTNIIQPFYEGNMIQIVVLGFVSGTVLLILGEKASTIRKFILEFKFFFFTILDAFVRILPFVISLSVIKVILTIDISDSMMVWKIIIVDQLLVIVIAIINLVSTSVQCKIPVKKLFNKIKPIFNLSLATGSSTAVIPDFYRILPNDLGIDEEYSNYWIPLSNSFFSPSTIIALIVYAFFSAQSQNVGLSIEWLLILYIMIIQIGMATPRIPGGIIASCSILFAQLGLNNDQIGIIMAANVLVLYLDTAVAGITRCCLAINQAKKQGYINLDKLRS